MAAKKKIIVKTRPVKKRTAKVATEDERPFLNALFERLMELAALPGSVPGTKLITTETVYLENLLAIQAALRKILQDSALALGPSAQQELRTRFPYVDWVWPKPKG